MTNADQLKQLKLDSGKTWPEIAKITGYSIHTLNAWISPETALKHRVLHDRELESIKLKVNT